MQPEPCRPDRRQRAQAWQPGRPRRHSGAGMVRRDRRDRRRGSVHPQTGRPGDVYRQRRLCRIRRHRLGPRRPDGRRHDLRGGRHPAPGLADHARRHRHERQAGERRERPDPGGRLRRRADGPSDRQADGRRRPDRHGAERRPPGTALRSSAPTWRSIRPIRPGTRKP